MITINENWAITADKYQFILVETYEGFDAKTSQPKKHTKQTYHAKLEHCLNRIRESECKACNTIDELKAALEKSYQIDRDSLLSVVNTRRWVKQ